MFSYTWSELDRPKGSCEIASAVYHRLKNTVFPPDKKETVRLVADGCGGQSKNSMLILMAKKDYQMLHIKKVELISSVTGHS